MPFRARLDGLNDYISFGGELPLAVDGYVEIAFVIQDISETFIRALSDNLTSTGNSRLIIETNGDRVLFRVNGSTDASWTGVFGSALTVGQRIVARVEHSGTNTLELFIDGVSKGTAVAPVSNQGVGNFEFCGVNGGVYSQIDVEYISLVNNVTPANSRYYDANASAGTGILVPETLENGADATMVNGGTWFEYSSAGESYSLVCDTVADDHNAGDVTLIYSGSGTAYTLTCDTVTDAHSAGDVELTYTPAPTATITSQPLKDNTGSLLASQDLDYVSIYDSTTGALVLRVTGISTNSSGIFSVSDAALTSGVTYKLDWKITAQASARMPSKAAS